MVGMKTPQYSSVNTKPLLVSIGCARTPVLSAPCIPADLSASPLSSFPSQIPPNWQESCTWGPALPSPFKSWAQGLKCGQILFSKPDHSILEPKVAVIDYPKETLSMNSWCLSPGTALVGSGFDC